MKTTATMKMAMGFLAVCLALGAAAADISGVTVRQRWPWSRLVDIDYVLCDATQAVDVAVTAYNGSTPLTLPDGSLSGDRYGVSADGTHRIVWDPTVTGYTNNEVLAKFKVSLAPTTPPVYMIVDLTKSAGADGQIEYIYPGDARLATEGRYTNVWFGVTNDSVYATATDKLVLRRVPASSFKMGDTVPTIATTLTKEFYAGVFEVTQAQWDRVMGGSSASTLPKVYVSYDDIRGSTNNIPTINWYATGSAVSSTNFIGRLRAKSGINMFDLPTEAQWECLCRAGTSSYYNDGNSSSADTTVLNRLAWWTGNSGGSAHAAGGKEANGWGLYDTHGNVWEWCLDWYAASLSGGSNPQGASSGSYRVFRSGCWKAEANLLSSGSRWRNIPSYKISDDIGFRLVITLP